MLKCFSKICRHNWIMAVEILYVQLNVATQFYRLAISTNQCNGIGFIIVFNYTAKMVYVGAAVNLERTSTADDPFGNGCAFILKAEEQED